MTAIIIFALAALFLGLRLYMVLGSRTGHEQSFPRPEEPKAVPAELKPVPESREFVRRAVNTATLAEENAVTGLRAIAAADRTFQLDDFIEGAKGAYGMILDAYWKGDLDAVSRFVSDDVRTAFAEAAAERAEAGEVLDNRLIAIERATVVGADLTDGDARITVRFEADIAAVTRNSEGVVVAGSLTDAIVTQEEWTFQRSLRSADPNWLLVDTDEA
ncbi:MAG TPA: Tim44/TimA family putative adaptor protein [Chakrabartia sp.]|nr:Tim44/TimA family putative adaptor protein [Chakrabartia sp.]